MEVTEEQVPFEVEPGVEDDRRQKPDEKQIRAEVVEVGLPV